MIMKEKSSLHLAIISNTYEFTKDKEKRVNYVMESLFPEQNKVVSRVSGKSSDSNIELIYEIQRPVFNEETATKEFYENLEILLEELREYNPHFTQYRRVD